MDQVQVSSSIAKIQSFSLEEVISSQFAYIHVKNCSKSLDQ